MKPATNVKKPGQVSQKLPASLALGSVLYSASAEVDPDSGKASTTIREYHVRTVRRANASDPDPTFYLVEKVDCVTWGKLSTRTGHVGWLESIPAAFRASIPTTEYMPPGFATTKGKACQLAIGRVKQQIERYKEWKKTPGLAALGYEDCIQECLLEIKALERRRTRLLTKN